MKMVYNWLVAAPTSVNTLKTTESGGHRVWEKGGREKKEARGGKDLLHTQSQVRVTLEQKSCVQEDRGVKYLNC